MSNDANHYDSDVPPASYAPGDQSTDDNTQGSFRHHGTAVSSIASSWTNNTNGLASPTFDLLPQPPFLETKGIAVALKWFGIGPTQGDFLSVTSCINHIAGEPSGRMRVANMSLAGPAEPDERQLLVRACKNAFMNGALLVASAGNTNDSVRTEPGSFDDFVLAVGACLWNNLYWTRANANPLLNDHTTGSKWGSWVDLVAPGGVGITAQKNRGNLPDIQNYFSMQNPIEPCNAQNYEAVTFSGTSAAAPLVSGVAAWLLRLRPSLTAEDAGQVILRTCTDMGAAGFDVRYGNGRLNAGAAAALVSSPNWIHHGALGLDGDGALTIEADSVTTTISLTGTTNLDGNHVCKRYRLTGHATFNAGFLQAPTAWIRRADSQGLPEVTSWNDDERAPWAKITNVSATGADLETYVYRLTDAQNAFFPVPPEAARVSYTAIGPSGSLDVKPGPSAGLKLRCLRASHGRSVRFEISGHSEGALKVELFDVAGRRVADLWQGAVAARDGLVVEWNGKDRSGNRAQRGVYICRVTQLGSEVAERIAWYW